jgi:predicted N-acetyltransferase YhbS
VGVSITQRRYRLLADFERVSDFLRQNFVKYQQNGNRVQPWWEYAHTHPWFNHRLTHRFGLWEEEGEIVAVACYEMDVGRCSLMTKLTYEYLKPRLLEWAEQELYAVTEDRKHLTVEVFDYETSIKDVLRAKGYTQQSCEPVTVFDYAQGFRERPLPEGFSLISLDDENDIQKIHQVLWRGFDHGDEPDDDTDCRLLMQSAPNFRKDLTIVIKAPNGEYACFAGMWLDGVNDFAYLEPLATAPRYRGMGLAAIALTESMKRTAGYGATYCFGDAHPFYFRIGFRTVCDREKWVKTW